MLDPVLLEEFMASFFGYGDLSAPLWFVGMEEGGGESIEEIEARLNAWSTGGKQELEDMAEFHASFGDASRFLPNAPVQRTWKELMRLALLARGESDELEAIREHQISAFGRSGGQAALLELMPLPKRSLRDWPYAAWTSPEAAPNLATRAAYAKAIRAPRIAAIRALIKAHAPKVVVFYGAGYRKHWELISGLGFEGGDFPKTARSGSTLFILLPHPVARGAVSERYRKASELAKKALQAPLAPQV